MDLTTSDIPLNKGPTCKKAVDFNDNQVFKTSTFEPTQEAIRRAEIAEERTKAQSRPSTSSPTTATVDIELTDSSDDELPDFKDLLQQTNSQKRGSSQNGSSSKKYIKRLESMKLEDDGLELVKGTSLPPFRTTLS